MTTVPELLDKFDPMSDGADRDWVSIYDESARLLYLEIDYLNEARNTMRFAEDFKKTPWVITPDVYLDLTTPRVLTMQVPPPATRALPSLRTHSRAHRFLTPARGLHRRSVRRDLEVD